MGDKQDNLGIFVRDDDMGAWRLLDVGIKRLLSLAALLSILLGVLAAVLTARAQIAGKADRSEVSALRQADSSLRRDLEAIIREIADRDRVSLIMHCRAPWNAKDTRCVGIEK